MSGRGRPATNPERRQRLQEAFLAAFGETGVAIMAATQAGIPAPYHYQWLREDPSYARRFADLKEKTSDLARRTRRRPGPKHGSRSGGPRAAQTARAQEAFLAAFAKCGVAIEAGRMAGVSVGTHQSWLQRDPQYAQRFEQAKEQTKDLRQQLISAHLSAAGKTRWALPGSREAWSEYQRHAWTPEKRTEAGRRSAEMHQRPEVRAKLDAARRAYWADPEARARNSERMKRLWEDPEYRERYQAAIDNPERRARLSQAAKQRWATLTPEQRKEHMRAMRRVFKGGHKLTQLEASVLTALNDRETPYLVHKPIDGYVADILIPSLNLVVECDGAWHHPQRQDGDSERDAALRALGYETLRLSEEEIKKKDWSRLDGALDRLAS